MEDPRVLVRHLRIGKVTKWSLNTLKFPPWNFSIRCLCLSSCKKKTEKSCAHLKRKESCISMEVNTISLPSCRREMHDHSKGFSVFSSISLSSVTRSLYPFAHLIRCPATNRARFPNLVFLLLEKNLRRIVVDSWMNNLRRPLKSSWTCQGRTTRSRYQLWLLWPQCYF